MVAVPPPPRCLHKVLYSYVPVMFRVDRSGLLILESVPEDVSEDCLEEIIREARRRFDAGSFKVLRKR